MESVDEEDLDDAQVYLRLMQEAVASFLVGRAPYTNGALRSVPGLISTSTDAASRTA